MFEALVPDFLSLSVFFLSVFVVSFTAAAVVFRWNKVCVFTRESEEAWLTAFSWLVFYFIFKQSGDISPWLVILPFIMLTAVGKTACGIQAVVCFACCFSVSFLLPPSMAFFPKILPFWAQRILIGSLLYLFIRLFSSLKQIPYILDDYVKILGISFLLLSFFRFPVGTEIYYAFIPFLILWAFSFFTLQSGNASIPAFGFLTGFFILYLAIRTQSFQPFVFIFYLLFEACYGFIRRHRGKEPEFFIQKTIQNHPEYTIGLLEFMKYRLMLFGLLSISSVLYKSTLIFVCALFLLYEIIYRQNRVGQPDATIRSIFRQMKEDWKNIKENYRQKKAEISFALEKPSKEKKEKKTETEKKQKQSSRKEKKED